MKRLVFAALLFAACGATEGTWGEVVFAPDRSGIAVADRHAIIERGGRASASLRAEGARTLSVLLSAAALPPRDVEWRRLSGDARRDLLRDLAERDTVLVENIALSGLEPGDIVPLDGGQLSLAMNVPARDLELGALRGSIEIAAVDVQPRGGKVAGAVLLEREGGDANGLVRVPFDLPLSLEILGEANLDFVAPVVRCADDRGPSRAAGCSAR